MKLYIPFSLLILPFSVNAQQMYKSVDERGNVSYSSTPSSQAVEVKEVAPPPPVTDEQIRHSQQQQESIRKKSERLGNEREQRALENAKKEPEEIEAFEPLEAHRKSTLNDPWRQGQNPSPGKPTHPIQPAPPPPVHLPARPAQLPANAN
jgi:hypothetical protein